MFDWAGSRPLDRQQQQLLAWYAADAKHYGCEVYCGTCPQVHSGPNVKPVCCRYVERLAAVLAPTWRRRLRRLRARLACLV